MTIPPPFPLPPCPAADLDLAIVGAGAAGIAAARRGLAAGLTVGLFEARPHLGGRAVTASFGGHPIDLGAHWLHAGHVNPLVREGLARGEPLRPSRGEPAIIQRGRPLSRTERRAASRGFDRLDRAIAGLGEADRAIGDILPPLGRWREAITDTLALVSGRPVAEVSARDFPGEEFGSNWFVRGGYGAYLGRLAAGLPAALACPVTAVDWSDRAVTLETGRGRVRARAAIVTVPVPVLAAGAIRFTPRLPAATADALAGFLPGAYEHVILNWPTRRLRGPDRLVKLVGTGPGNVYGMLAAMDGAPFHYMELGWRSVAAPRCGAEARGGDRLARLARSVLRAQFGAEAVRRLRVLHVTDWLGDPWSRGAWGVLPPGRSEDRGRLAAPLGERLWLAGEATSRRMWGTVGGAWEEGWRAAGEAAAILAGEAAALLAGGGRVSAT